ncbi:MAG: hydrogenase maturation protease [Pseudomonadota bacterium]
MRTRVIGLGNTILSDDGIGVYVAREVALRLIDARGETVNGRYDQSPLVDIVDIVESEVAGFALLELVTGWDRVILVDAMVLPDADPGTVVRLGERHLQTSLRLRSVHETDLPTVLELGNLVGLPMPKELVIFGIQIQDAFTFGEELTPPLQNALERTVDLVMAELLP